MRNFYESVAAADAAYQPTNLPTYGIRIERKRERERETERETERERRSDEIIKFSWSIQLLQTFCFEALKGLLINSLKPLSLER